MVTLDFGAVLAEWPLLLRGVGMTVGLTVVAAVLGAALGVGCAWARLHGGRGLRAVAAGYVELIRNTPFIVQLFFLYFGLPGLGLRLSPEVASVLAMVLNLGAYAGEIVRAGLEGTPPGQIEAARSLALTDLQVFTRIVLPPALGRVWPAMVGQIVIVMLGSAVCGQIATAELSHAANLVHSRNFRAFEATILATAVYLLLAIVLRQTLHWLGPRWVFGRVAPLGGAGR
ncbi:amino acid ABC transporter permease [Sphaerotilus montanus]|uniref:Polar amino acid transport system permease protein n=1 Tax=Sphaerotilus montanus TaxID=522889 RepID=A0A7Y9QZV3_9BURK|nr:amino acid ABC transporter permease [Sphaerotilus montanus]NYG32342.1 polar amino acid transport system permease protein [Sphaerotilus montanus]NZD56174.1 amino acid ABC transporter permease [Sphaerotilus montanus]